MRKFALLCLLFTAPLFADQITFSFVSLAGNLQDVSASTTGLTAGPALNTSVTDSTSGVIVPLDGRVTASTGAASTFNVFSTITLATFSAGGSNSVLITSGGKTILSGTTNDNASLVATHQGGTGAFLSGFELTFIDPVLLKEFGLSSVDPRGSLGITFGQDVQSAKAITAVEGGGTITLTATAVSEPKDAGLIGLGLLLLMLTASYRWRYATTNSITG